jgi:hypothetical protein
MVVGGGVIKLVLHSPLRIVTLAVLTMAESIPVGPEGGKVGEGTTDELFLRTEDLNRSAKSHRSFSLVGTTRSLQ